MTTLKREGIMLWFALGLMLGGFLGMLLVSIFASKRRPEGLYGDKMGDPEEEAFRKASPRLDNHSGVNNNSTPLG
jgi:hypothetical protein